MASFSVLQAVLQKHGRTRMMDHLRPTHKGDRQAGGVDVRGWWLPVSCPLAGPVLCQSPFIIYAGGSDCHYRGNADTRSSCPWLCVGDILDSGETFTIILLYDRRLRRNKWDTFRWVESCLMRSLIVINAIENVVVIECVLQWMTMALNNNSTKEYEENLKR